MLFPPLPPSRTQGGRAPHAARDAQAARHAPPRPSPPPKGKKLAATNERPRRSLTSAGRRAALPGDPGGSAFSPLPRCALPRRRATPGLYKGRTLSGLQVPPVRELPTARAGGRPGRRAALSLLLCPPLRATASRLLLGRASTTFRPSLPLARYSSWFEPRRTEGSSQPPRLQFRPFTGPRKNVDHTSVSLLRYRLLVQGKSAAGKDSVRPGTLWSSKTCRRAGPERGGRDPSKLTLRVEGSPGVSRTVCLRLWAWRAGRERGAARSSRTDRGHAAGTSQTAFAPPTPWPQAQDHMARPGAAGVGVLYSLRPAFLRV